MTRQALLAVALTTALTHTAGAYYTTPGTTDATTTTGLTATVGPGFAISLKKGGRNVTSLKRGTYRIVVNDNSRIHNFHLTGPGLNMMTTVRQIGRKTWNVTLKRGTYNFVCDPHASAMKGSFRVTL